MNDDTTKRAKPELLAPAGSMESFHAAIDAGADAVYLGLGDFNARLRAKNFTTRDLCTLVPYARSRNVKTYVTINTLIKQNEIKPAIDTLYQLNQIGVDAVIVADIGLMKLSSTHFPDLRIHGSTQAAVHNSYGAELLKSLGAKRVVLARELSLDEIRETTKKSPIEIEVFVHGALCCSISGMCLASSFIGGASGNRGRCTQVCRRKFRCAGGEGYFFSPYDLQAVSVIDKLVDVGVSSLKIEGRMKGAEYVSTVVKAYRRVIDSPGDIVQAVDELRFDFGRAKTMFFLDGRNGESPINPSRPSGTGILLGTIIGRDDRSFTLSTRINGYRGDGGDGSGNGNDDLTIAKGDRLRVQPQSGFEGIACKVAKCAMFGDSVTAELTTSIECSVGDHVFLIGKADRQQSSISYGNHKNIITESPTINLKPNFPNSARIANSLSPRPVGTKNVNTNDININIPKPKLWFKADRTDWLDIISATPCKYLIFDADVREINKLLDNPATIKTWRSRIVVAIPPFIDECNLGFWRNIIKECLSAGLQSFTISNAGHFPIVNGAKRLVADAPLWCVNRFTQKELEARGVGEFVISYEDEYLNIRNTADCIDSTAISGIAPVYGKPPMFISRMPPGINCDTVVTDPHGGKFFVARKNGLYYTLPDTPMCLFAKRKKLSECGIENFLIDVCFHTPDYEIINKLITGFRDGVRVENGTLFNFKAGLR